MFFTDVGGIFQAFSRPVSRVGREFTRLEDSDATSFCYVAYLFGAKVHRTSNNTRDRPPFIRFIPYVKPLDSLIV